MASIDVDELDELETRKYAYLLDLAKELGFTCKGNPKKARVIKFIRQSVVPGLLEKENEDSPVVEKPAVPKGVGPTPAAQEKAVPTKPDGGGSVPPTPSGSRPHRPGQTPNFAKIHRAAFAKLKSITEYASQKDPKTPLAKSRIPKYKPKKATPAQSLAKEKRGPKDTQRVLPKRKSKTAESNSATNWAAATLNKAATAVQTIRQGSRLILGQVRSNRRFDLLLAKRGIKM